MLLFNILVFGHKACESLAPWRGVEASPPALRGEGLTTGPSGKSQFCYLSYLLTYKGRKVQGHVFTQLALPGTPKPAVRLKSIPWRLTSPLFLSLEPVIPPHTIVLPWIHSPPIPAPLSGNFAVSLVDHRGSFVSALFKLLLLVSRHVMSDSFYPMHCSMPGFTSFTVFWSLLKLMSIESVMLSKHLILCTFKTLVVV